MNEIKAIIFDLGRVLVGIDDTRYVRVLGNGMAGADAGAITRIMSDELFIQFDKGLLSPRKYYDAVCTKTGINHSYDEFISAYCDVFQPMDGIKQLLGELKSKYRIGLLSDTNPIHFEYILRHYPYVADIENPTLSFNLGVMKPDKAIYQVAADNVKTDIGHCLFIDDLQKNVIGAINAGMHAIRFEGVERLRQQLSELL